jgi:NADH-quinone oxidoreductase subunit A
MLHCKKYIFSKPYACDGLSHSLWLHSILSKSLVVSLEKNFKVLQRVDGWVNDCAKALIYKVRATDRRRDKPTNRLGKEEIMTEVLSSYIPIAIFIGIALVIGLALLITPFAVAYKNPDPEKLSAFECGFNAFDDARMKFDIRFYLVSILFIIFDLEVAFLFPWAVSFGEIGWFGFWSMMVFLFVLTIGFIYEWKKGALEWA